MYLTNTSLSLIKSLSKKGQRRALHNNILAEELHSAISYFKKMNNSTNDSFIKRKFVEDTGYQKVDNLFTRKRVVSKLVDRNGKKNIYAQKRILSRYDSKGRLVTRQIEKQHEIYLATEKSIVSEYNAGKPCVTKVISNVNDIETQRIIQKGHPTKIITKQKLKSHPKDVLEIITERDNSAHLNKSNVKYAEIVKYNYGTTDSPDIKIVKKAVMLKSGLKLQKCEHNGTEMLVEIPAKGKGQVVIHKTQEDINNCLSRFDTNIQNYLK